MNLEDIKAMKHMGEVTNFVIESNRIERIPEVRDGEVDELLRFIALEKLTIEELERFVSVNEPTAKLRRDKGMNVKVGNHIAPYGGPYIVQELGEILAGVSDAHPWRTHRMYLSLHPFMDCNGRSGRAVWAWQMVNQARPPGLSIGFLHAFYYQTLQEGR